MAFKIDAPDLEQSPFTGMTRKHWLDSGQFLLEGVFQHVKEAADPVALPKQPGKTYPQPDHPAWRHRSAEFEGLARTFMIAGPLVAERPDATAAGHGLRDYYAQQILLGTDPNSPRYLFTVPELAAEYQSPLYQHTCESAALVLGLETSRRQIWERYSKAEKDQIATFLSATAHARTNGHNWRFFNVVIASFLRKEGYDVDAAMVEDHLQHLLAYYAGNGWYRDNATFDYYSCWAFNFYAPLWCRWYGFEQWPEYARVFERYHAELMRTYPKMFGRDGKSFMWGRSIIYRCAASAPLVTGFLFDRPGVDAGWARRIASGNLLQFIGRDDVFVDGTPGLGFYRPFDPMVQGYSCAASPFWLAKVYLGLAVPADNPLWTAQENEGDWPTLDDTPDTIVVEAPGLVITRHGTTNTCELLSGKHAGGKKSDPNYDRLAYNTEFLWEDNNAEGATAMAYSIAEANGATDWAPNVGQMFVGESGGVIYRQSMLRGWMSRVDLADIPIRGGTVRVDRPRVGMAYDLRLAHYGLPHVDGAAEVRELTVQDRSAIIGKAGDRSVALVAFHGWDGVGTESHQGLNAEADQSTVIFAARSRNAHYSGMTLAVTVMLHRTDGVAFTPEDLDVIESLEVLPFAPSGAPQGARIRLRNGASYLVDFGGMEGQLQA